MMNKIRTWLIHLLGGVTESENLFENNRSYKLGGYDICTMIHEKMKSINGYGADVWCDIAYSFVNNLHKNLKNGNKDNQD